MRVAQLARRQSNGCASRALTRRRYPDVIFTSGVPADLPFDALLLTPHRPLPLSALAPARDVGYSMKTAMQGEATSSKVGELVDLIIRGAGIEDADAIAAIYNHYILGTTVTFDTEPKSAEDRVRWMEEHDELHPVLVGEIDGEIVAWGALTRWGQRPAWRHTVEISVYVAPDSTGRGIGPAMTEALVSEATRLGHHALIAQIVAENGISLLMSQRAGFDRVGILREVGRKFDRWLDVVLVERILGDPYGWEN